MKAKAFRVEVDGSQDETGRILERRWEEHGPAIDWTAFPQGYGVLLSERLQYPCDPAAWRMKIDATRQLFVDDYLIAHQQNLRRTLHDPKAHPANPIFDADCDAAFVLPDEEHGYRMYYQTAGWYNHLAYSADGVEWRRPALDVYDITQDPDRFPGPPGSPESPNNVVLPGEINALVIDADESDPSQRWKALIRPWRGLKGPGTKVIHPYRTKEDGSHPPGVLHALYISPDGIRWQKKSDISVLKGDVHFEAPDQRFYGIGDLLKARWDPRLKTYIGAVKQTIGPDYRFTPVFHHARVLCMIESDDMVHWSLPRVYAYPDGEDAKSPGMYGIYEDHAFNYESMWLNLFSMTWYSPATREWMLEVNQPENRPYIKRNRLRLAASRDGRHYCYLAERKRFNLPSPSDDWDIDVVRVANQGAPVVRGDELWFYYRGNTIDGPKKTWKMGNGIATLRRDGFASLDAADEPGVVITRPFVFAGDGRLCVNTDVGASGSVRVAVLNEAGEPIDHFTIDDAVAVCEDSTQTPVYWKNRESLAELKDRYIRLVFHLVDAELYSFWIE